MVHDEADVTGLARRRERAEIVGLFCFLCFGKNWKHPHCAEMASGFGVTGKKGRCYDVWMDFSECMSHCAMPADCTSRRDDYFECLHHRKEVLFSASPSALALI